MTGVGRPENVGVVVIHGVGEAMPGWTWNSLVPPLRRVAGLSFAPFSEVRQLEDLGRVQSGKTFEFRVQRGEMENGPKVSFMELFWADLSRSGDTFYSRTLAMWQLFFEAPHVLGQSFLRNPLGPIHRMLRFLVILAAWLIRWPIAGVNMSTFTCCFALVSYEQFRFTGSARYEPYIVVGMLAALAVCAFVFATWRMRHDIVLTEIGLAVAIFSTLMAIAVAGQAYYTGGDSQSNVPSYLVHIAYVILVLWAAWTAVVVVAAGLLLLLFLQRLITPEHPTRRSVSRTASALGLIIAQGLIWKIVVSLFSILIVGAVVRSSVDPGAVCSGAASYCTNLRDININLFGVAAFNLLFLIGLAFLYAGVCVVRLLMRKYFSRLVRGGRMRLPRLIINPVLLAALIIGTVYNAYIFYVIGYDDSALFQMIKRHAIDNNALVYITGGSTGLFLFLNWMPALQQAAGGVVHIGRDLVDHQYDPGRTMARVLMVKSWRKLGRHPRRIRIQGRLDSMIKNFAMAEKFDRLVFVAHSQGSVIMYDFLKSTRDDKLLADIERIDVLTLGSPLSHLYQFYFSEYEKPVTSPERLHRRLASWTNMWRSDDPIGNRVDIVDGDFIANRPLGSGGHVDYWREKDVCRVICDLIRGMEAGPDRATAREHV